MNVLSEWTYMYTACVYITGGSSEGDLNGPSGGVNRTKISPFSERLTLCTGVYKAFCC
jgi:hypothetical protein